MPTTYDDWMSAYNRDPVAPKQHESNPSVGKKSVTSKPDSMQSQNNVICECIEVKIGSSPTQGGTKSVFIILLYTLDGIPPAKGQRYRCKLDTMQDVKREMAKVYRESRSQQIDPAEATKLVWMLQAVAKVIEGSDFEKRIEALEQKI